MANPTPGGDYDLAARGDDARDRQEEARLQPEDATPRAVDDTERQVVLDRASSAYAGHYRDGYLDDLRVDDANDGRDPAVEQWLRSDVVDAAGALDAELEAGIATTAMRDHFKKKRRPTDR